MSGSRARRFLSSVAASAVITAHAQTAPSPTQLLAIATTAAQAASSSPDAFKKEFRKLLKPIVHDYAGSQHVFRLTGSPGVTLWAEGPIYSFERAMSEAIRLREPITGITPRLLAQIHVEPTAVNAPDILKVILEVEGREIAPLPESDFHVEELTSAMGVKASRHRGVLVFPSDVFAEWRTVKVTFIPATGSNLKFTLDRYDLHFLQ
jgi:hypothetical protein